MASRLSPFLPASDPRLPGARQGKVLSLHHLEGKILAYMNTQLSRYNDLAAHPLYLAIQFRANGSHTPAAADPKRDRAGSGCAASLQARPASKGAIIQASLASPAAAAKPFR